MKKYFLAWLLFFIMTVTGYAQMTLSSGLTPELQSHQSIILLIEPENGNIIDANKAASLFYGYSNEQLRRMTIQEINALEPFEVQAEFKRARDEERNYFIFPHRLKSGKIRTVEVFSSPFETPSGKKMLLSIIHDATDKILVEEELQRYKNRLEELVEIKTQEALRASKRANWITILGIITIFTLGFLLFQRYQKSRFLNRQLELEQDKQSLLKRFEYLNRYANDIILLVDRHGQIVEANERAASMHGFSRDELLQKNITELTDLEKHISCERIQEKADLEQGYIYETAHMRRDGTIFPVESSVRHIKIGEQDFCQHIIRDITERKQGEEALIQAKEQAESANQAKSEFLANMSHEIRTPINGIMGMMQLLQMSELDKEQKEYVDLTISSASRLTRLLSDILDLSRVEARMMTIHDTEFVVQELIDSVSELFKVAAREKGLTLKFDVDPEIPSCLIGDEVRVRQILFNLVGNALKFTRKGSVQVEMFYITSNQEEGCRILFTISDTGVGIPDEQLKNLFKPFVQVDGSYNRSFEGAGLGLAIVKRLVDLLGGNINIISEAGEGTCIYVVLPFLNVK
ncbi:MAG: PAS domain-containing sensor histidine kinase [Desulfonatronovibrio sp.]